MLEDETVDLEMGFLDYECFKFLKYKYAQMYPMICL